ncbi:ATP-binding cassette domain-containing protein [Paenibacillus sp. CR_12]|uniref:ATP-binding cassette domain-containing protein n=1 Tax=Paenibacillus sp. CR_12 TaxID=3055793 RepID=UPI0035C0A72D
MITYAVEIRQLRKSFGHQTVLDGIDLSVPQGNVFALLGPNGAGKTTLIHILSTLVTPDVGSVRINGFDLRDHKQEVQQSISLTGQFAAVDEVLTAEENLRMICRLSGLSAAEAGRRTAELLEHFDLAAAAAKRVKTYSGGMKRRLDLAISLVVPRPVLFLDEPTTGLDTRSRRALWDIILQLKSQGITILLTTQYLEEADQLADRIAVLDGGRIVAEGSPAELKTRVGGEMLELRDARDEVIHRIPTSGSIGDVAHTLQEFIRLLPNETRVSLHRPNMDDVFLSLTDKKMEGIV